MEGRSTGELGKRQKATGLGACLLSGTPAGPSTWSANSIQPIASLSLCCGGSCPADRLPAATCPAWKRLLVQAAVSIMIPTHLKVSDTAPDQKRQDW